MRAELRDADGLARFRREGRLLELSLQLIAIHQRRKDLPSAEAVLSRWRVWCQRATSVPDSQKPSTAKLEALVSAVRAR